MSKTNPKPVELPEFAYIVNPSGAIQLLDRESYKALMRYEDSGYRFATKAEIAALKAAGGNQIAGRPIAKTEK